MNAPDPTMTDERLDSLERWREEMDRKWLEAFPGGDQAGHRRFHELMIEQAADRRKLIAAIKEKTISGLVWATMISVGIACWKYFLTLISKAA